MANKTPSLPALTLQLALCPPIERKTVLCIGFMRGKRKVK